MDGKGGYVLFLVSVALGPETATSVCCLIKHQVYREKKYCKKELHGKKRIQQE